MKITYYLEVISSWCFWAEPAWAELKARYEGRDDVEFTWKLALMDASGLPVSRAQCDWFYRRSGTHMRAPFMLNSGWFDPELKEYLAPNLVAEAARELGATDDRVRLALARAALRDGRPIGQWKEAVAVAAEAGGLDPDALLALARSPQIEARARATTQEFHALGVTQRPTFVFENAGGDRAVLSGLATAAPLFAVAEALLADETFARAYASHHGGPPAA
ncbi:MAG: DsbA family protein [Verrucomicrobia bacterium]|nr:DsbA family protein [Verrucomicrobiota bacterium]